MGISIIPYMSDHAETWNTFVTNAKNGVFLFDRQYMEYHADRFHDASLLVLHEDEIVALFPATRHDDRIVSHGGLTFGGFIIGASMKASLMLAIMDAVRELFWSQGIVEIVYKAIPHMYHDMPAEEDLYALFRARATLIRRDVSSTIELQHPLPRTKGRNYSVKKARKLGVDVRRSTDFTTFMAIEERQLTSKYGVKPVHTASELALLASRFPDNIKLFAGFEGDEMHAGVVVYESRHVAHAQYIGATPRSKELCALDLVLDHLIGDVYAAKKYFDFGISTEQAGQYLNEGLIGYKESYGARATVYDTYRLIRPASD